MHELLLYGQIPQSRHEQLLHILAGVAAMQPQRLLERHVVYKPTRGPAPRQAQVGGSQGIKNPQRQALQAQLMRDLYYTRLVESLDEADLAGGSGSARDPRGGGEATRRRWSLQFQDVPDAGKRPAVSRMVADTDITDGDPHQYMRGLGYSYVSEYILEGHRFVHKNVVILLHRIRHMPPSNEPLQAPMVTLPSLPDTKLLDGSGGYMLQASVRVQDAGKPDVMSRASDELERFRGLMKGVVDLSVPDRLAMDTRVK